MKEEVKTVYFPETPVVLEELAPVNENLNRSGGYQVVDGKAIRVATITTSKLNFTPATGDNVIATINASTEDASLRISAARINITGSTTFASGYDPTSKVDEVGGTYDTAASGARVRIFPDANTGIQVIDDGGADVFKAVVGGTDVGDVIIGNYSANQGAKYDKSANTFDIRGTLTAADISAGGTITGSTITSGVAASTNRVSLHRAADPSYPSYLRFIDASDNVAAIYFDSNVLTILTNSTIKTYGQLDVNGNDIIDIQDFYTFGNGQLNYIKQQNGTNIMSFGTHASGLGVYSYGDFKMDGGLYFLGNGNPNQDQLNLRYVGDADGQWELQFKHKDATWAVTMHAATL